MDGAYSEEDCLAELEARWCRPAANVREVCEAVCDLEGSGSGVRSLALLGYNIRGTAHTDVVRLLRLRRQAEGNPETFPHMFERTQKVLASIYVWRQVVLGLRAMSELGAPPSRRDQTLGFSGRSLESLTMPSGVLTPVQELVLRLLAVCERRALRRRGSTVSEARGVASRFL